MEVEPAFPIDNPNNDLKTHNLKLTLKDLYEAMQTARSHKGGPADDAIKQMMTWMKQRRQS
jgi:hypothetical protein